MSRRRKKKSDSLPPIRMVGLMHMPGEGWLLVEGDVSLDDVTNAQTEGPKSKAVALGKAERALLLATRPK